jgi:surfactin synthase thioesterase subunit
VAGVTPLLCLPFAGSGAGFFRPWTGRPSGVVRVEPVQLPGREELFGIPMRTDAGRVVAGLLPGVLDRTRGCGEVALFGHSMGAVLAYELAHALAAARPGSVAHLFVSGSPGPWTPRSRRATGLPDREFLERVREFAGYDHAAMSNPELRELLLPALRADVALHEFYVPGTERPLDAPITSFRGAGDRLVSAAQAAEWRDATTRECEVVELSGGHMYLADSADELLARLESVLAGGRRSAAAGR